MNILAKGVITEDLIRKLESAGPFFLAESRHGQSFEYVQILFVIIRPLFFHPLVITSAHKLTTVEFNRGFVASETTVLVPGAAGRVAFPHKTIEFLYVNRVREIRVEYVIAVTIEKEVLFERLIVIERLADV